MWQTPFTRFQTNRALGPQSRFTALAAVQPSRIAKSGWHELSSTIPAEWPGAFHVGLKHGLANNGCFLAGDTSKSAPQVAGCSLELMVGRCDDRQAKESAGTQLVVNWQRIRSLLLTGVSGSFGAREKDGPTKMVDMAVTIRHICTGGHQMQ